MKWTWLITPTYSPSFASTKARFVHCLPFLSHLVKISGVIHFAGLKSVPDSVSHPLKYFHNNVVGSLNLLNCMASNNVHNIIFSSSASVYGIPKVQYIQIALSEIVGRPDRWNLLVMSNQPVRRNENNRWEAAAWTLLGGRRRQRRHKQRKFRHFNNRIHTTFVERKCVSSNLRLTPTTQTRTVIAKFTFVAVDRDNFTIL